MGMIKDFLRRQEIDAKAQSLVNEHFTDLLMKKITESNNDKKTQRKLDTTSQQLKRHANEYIHDMELGLYGKPRFLKAVQENLFNLGLGGDIVNKIIRSLV